MLGMPNVLIRDVPAEDLDQIRHAASRQGTSLQGYLRDTILAQASYLRRREALARTKERLAGSAGVSEEERKAVLSAVEEAHGERADRLSGRQSL